MVRHVFIHNQRGAGSTQEGRAGDTGGVLGDQNRLWQVKIKEGFSFEDLLVELGTLEEKALGQKVHGRQAMLQHLEMLFPSKCGEVRNPG